VRLVLAEDHALLRAGLIQLLEGNGFTILRAVDNADDLAEALLDPDADAAVVDVRLPPTQSDEGLVAAIAARAARPAVRGRSATCSRTGSPTWRSSWTAYVGWPRAGPCSTPR
jgi:DNA-binding NarL/FixJ family response regulator